MKEIKKKTFGCMLLKKDPLIYWSGDMQKTHLF